LPRLSDRNGLVGCPFRPGRVDRATRPGKTMNYLRALRLCHEILAPSNYLEIGCRHGTSLALSRCPAIAVDPAFELRRPARAGVQLFEMTSAHFFAAHDPGRILGEPVDFAFIDGMHHSEFALRDFMHIERCSRATSVIAI